MSILKDLRAAFARALSGLVDDPAEYLELIRPAQDARFGDYQANLAMPLGKRLGRAPREVAAEIVARLDLAAWCEPPEVAGPGFINLRLKDDELSQRLLRALGDERLGVATVQPARCYVIDYSSPNVAKPMHVGHIRSTVIGDALCRALRFLGHRVLSDNHLGDWGTQFGMIIYGYKHFLDEASFRQNAVLELSRLYKFVHRLVDYREAQRTLPVLQRRLAEREENLAALAAAPPTGDKAVDKRAAQEQSKLRQQIAERREEVEGLTKKIAAIEADAALAAIAGQHADIEHAVLQETARLHEGDPENRRLWNEFLPLCRADIQRVYDRLSIRFDYEYGESHYHDLLASVVADFQGRGLARESDGAMCVFLDGFETPMIVRKRDGAFLYATTDLATVRYRMEQWRPDAILYVVDHRQSEHFEKFFAASRLWGYRDVELRHLSFGTVLGEDGRPYKTRSGDTVGLEGLLDEAERKAYDVVCQSDDAKPGGAELSEEQRRHVATVVGIGGLKYADLSQNRTSDYVFSYDKMLALTGNTATYLQYSYARVMGVFRKGNIDPEQLRRSGATIRLTVPAERAVGVALARFGDALDETVADYRPNVLAAYLYDVTKTFFGFYEQCPVLKADDAATRDSRLLLCDLVCRTIRLGLQLLGIDVVERM